MERFQLGWRGGSGFMSRLPDRLGPASWYWERFFFFFVFFLRTVACLNANYYRVSIVSSCSAVVSTTVLL